MYKILQENGNNHIQVVIGAGLVPKMIGYIKQQNYSQLQLYAVKAHGIISTDTREQSQTIIKVTIPLFVNHVRSDQIAIVYWVIKVVGNISVDSVFERDSIIMEGGLNKLI
jgi:hypothetical protein